MMGKHEPTYNSKAGFVKMYAEHWQTTQSGCWEFDFAIVAVVADECPTNKPHPPKDGDKRVFLQLWPVITGYLTMRTFIYVLVGG